jgi:hypothetical protein
MKSGVLNDWVWFGRLKDVLPRLRIQTSTVTDFLRQS